MKLHVKQTCGIEFLHAEKIAPIDIKQHLLKAYGDQTVDLSTERQWVVCFSSGDRDCGSPPLVQIFMSTTCSLLFVAIKSAQLLVLTILKKSIVQLRICSINQCYCTISIFCSCHGNKQEALLSEQFTYVFYEELNLAPGTGPQHCLIGIEAVRLVFIHFTIQRYQGVYQPH